MARQKLSMSEKIRNQLALGKTPKEISKYLKCSTGLVYAVRSADKKKEEKVWKAASVSTSAKPVSAQIRADILDTIVANKPGAIRYGETVFVPDTPKDYAVPKRNIVQRFFNWICGG
jgi:hypothetical protein